MASIEINMPQSEITRQPRFQLKRKNPNGIEHQGLEYIYLTCPYCQVKARFVPVHDVKVNWGDKDFGLYCTYHYLLNCEHCNDIVYARFWEVDFDPDWQFSYEYHHPVTSEEEGLHLPDLVSVSINEAAKCLNSGAYMATVVMCRRAIEAVLQDQGGSPNDSLSKLINKLSVSDPIQESMRHLSDLVRLVGNIGAHASALSVDEHKASETYALTKQLVDMIYLVPKRTEALKQKLVKAQE